MRTVLVAGALAFVAISFVGLVGTMPPADSAYPGVNGKIVWMSDRSGDADLWAMNADGSNPTNLTNVDGFDYDPQWSPDGSKIAYFSCRDGVPCNLYVMDADGSNQTQITDDPSDDFDPTWSPDGTKLAYSRDPDPEVLVINSDGTGAITNLTNNAAFDGDPAWSPDGTKIVFDSDRQGVSDIWVMDADGGNPVNLTSTPTNHENNPAWSPDGTKIAYTNDGDDNIWVMDADGGNKIRLTQDPEFADDPAWSPDGTMMAFTSYRDDDDGDIYVMPVNGVAAAGGGDGAINITNSPGEDRVPDWGVQETTPTPSPTPTPTGVTVVWADDNCSGQVDPIDSLLTLRSDAGLSVNTGDCPPFGTDVSLLASALLWGDIDCSGAIDPIDSLKILRFDAGLSVAQGTGCPAMGSEVTIGL